MDIKDVKPPVDPPNMLFGIFLFVMAIIILATGIFFFVKRKKKAPEVVRIKTPLEVALEELDRIHREKLLEQRKVVEFYLKLSDVVRRYFEDQFAIRAPEMTTEEFLISLRTSQKLNDQEKTHLKEFLVSCDMVKFAKHSPEIKDMEESFRFAKNLIEETAKRFIQN